MLNRINCLLIISNLVVFPLILVGNGCYTVNVVNTEQKGGYTEINVIGTNLGSPECGYWFDFVKIEEDGDILSLYSKIDNQEYRGIRLPDTDPVVLAQNNKYPPGQGYKWIGFKMVKDQYITGVDVRFASPTCDFDTICTPLGEEGSATAILLGIYPGDELYLTGYSSPNSSGLPVPDGQNIQKIVVPPYNNIYSVPSLSEWGRIGLILALLATTTWIFLWRRRSVRGGVA